jgi:hypothetical protein
MDNTTCSGVDNSTFFHSIKVFVRGYGAASKIQQRKRKTQ